MAIADRIERILTLIDQRIPGLDRVRVHRDFAGVRADLDDETVYQMTKTFWDNIEQVTSEAPWAKALNIDFAASQRGLMQLHPGAERYYREVGALQ